MGVVLSQERVGGAADDDGLAELPAEVAVDLVGLVDAAEVFLDAFGEQLQDAEQGQAVVDAE